MLNTLLTLVLGGVVAAFAIFAVLLNEGEHSARRRRTKGRGKRQAPAPASDAPGVLHGEELVMDGTRNQDADGRRLPVGDFLFGALFLRGEAPLPFADLAKAAGESGLDVSQVLSWIARAEEGGLVERVTDPVLEGETPGQPAVRLTPAGMELARNNRRAGRGAGSLEADIALHAAE